MQLGGDPAPAAAAATDAALVERARQGDTGAYAELVRRYTPIAQRTATLIVGASDAEDAVQDAFVRAYYALDRYRTDRPFRPWLLTIVVNAARNTVRSNSRQPRLRDRLAGDRAAGVFDDVPSAESTALGVEDQRRLADAVDELPGKMRLVVVCRYLLELSEAETAQVLGLPSGTVKSRLSRGLDVLRRALTTEGVPQ